MNKFQALHIAINALILRHVQLSQCSVCGLQALEMEKALEVLRQMKEEHRNELG